MRVQLPLKTTWYCHTHRKNSLHSLPHSERIFRSDRGCFTHRGKYSKPAIQVSGPTAAAPVAAAEVSLTAVKRWSERRFSQKGGSNEQVTEKTSSNDFGNFLEDGGTHLAWAAKAEQLKAGTCSQVGGYLTDFSNVQKSLGKRAGTHPRILHASASGCDPWPRLCSGSGPRAVRQTPPPSQILSPWWRDDSVTVCKGKPWGCGGK